MEGIMSSSSRIPSRFVGLHGHSGFSPFDGLGYPDEHFKWCIENGIDAHAITEHGNMNSYAHAQLWIEKWNSTATNKFKYIPGVEAYFHPDLSQWQRDKDLADQAQIDKKAASKIAKQQEELRTKIIARVDDADETEEIETTNALTIENEDETKSTKHFNPVNRRHHLVVLPKNQKGLLSIFSACSKAYLQGFYRFPRMDFNMLKEAGKDGNIVVTSACIGGFPAWSVFQELQKFKFDDLNQALLDDAALLEKCVRSIGNTYDMMTQAVGEGNYFLELQFNKLPAQNLVNRAIMEFARRNSVTDQLVVTCDSHYPRPEFWKERELYKKLGFMNYTTYNPDSLPKSKDDLKCELYPKNASQVWDEYLKSKVGTSFYDDGLIADAIERSHDIAHRVIGEVPPDRSPKFPNEKLIPAGTPSFNHLVNLCKVGMKKRGLEDKPVYIDRLREELGVIKTMKNADYFISYQKIMELAREVCLVGPARGSGGGSLVAYVLYITDLDPIYWDLPFSRFLSVYRQGAPDIDCLRSDHLVKTPDGFKALNTLNEGDVIVDHMGVERPVLFVTHRKQREDEICYEFLVKKESTYGTIVASEKHRFLQNDGSEIFAHDIIQGSTLMPDVRVLGKRIVNVGSLTDISVGISHTFMCIPFDVLEVEENLRQYLIHTDTYEHEVQEDFDAGNCWVTWI